MNGAERFTESELIEALRDCFIPKSTRNVVTSGIVRSATLERDSDAPGAGIPGVPDRYIARVTLAAPGSDEALNAQLGAIVENRLLGLPAIARAVVTILPPLFSILS